jgi:hypothetical protein
VESDYVELLWLHKSTNITKFFYLNDTPDIVHTESIICNGVEFKPVYGNKQLLWKLLTPVPFIQALNFDPSKMPILAAPFTSQKPKPKSKKNVDLISLVFNSADEFVNFLYAYE